MLASTGVCRMRQRKRRRDQARFRISGQQKGVSLRQGKRDSFLGNRKTNPNRVRQFGKGGIGNRARRFNGNSSFEYPEQDPYDECKCKRQARAVHLDGDDCVRGSRKKQRERRDAGELPCSMGHGDFLFPRRWHQLSEVIHSSHHLHLWRKCSACY